RAATKAASRRDRIFGAMPRLCWKSEKRVKPRNRASRRIRRLQRSPTSSSVRAAAQSCPSYSLPSISRAYAGLLASCKHRAIMMQARPALRSPAEQPQGGFRMSMSASSIPVFEIGLNALSAILDKAEAHAEARKIDPTVLLNARLFPDMFAFIRQVQIVCDQAKNASSR